MPSSGHSIVTPLRILRVGLLLFLLALAIALVSLAVGPGQGDPLVLLQRLLRTGQGLTGGLTETDRSILFSIRLPRILMAGIVGAALALAGAVFQAVLRNPLADPYILGVSGGAAVGAVSGILLGMGALPFGVSAMAFAGGLLSMFSVFSLARGRFRLWPQTLLLTGVVVNALCNAVLMFLLTIASSTDLHSVMFWLMGDLGLAGRGDILFSSVFLALFFVVLYVEARPLNLLVVGEDAARQLGVSVARTRRILLAAASLMTGLAVSVSGTIGFVGLLIPHLMRLAFGPDHRLLLVTSLLFGAGFLMLADTAARLVLAPTELPVGVITALCGAPYFLYLMHRKGR